MTALKIWITAKKSKYAKNIQYLTAHLRKIIHIFCMEGLAHILQSQSLVCMTTGRPNNMSMLEKIIFISDYIEPLRKPIPELDAIRRLAFEDIDKAMEKILGNTLRFLEEKHYSIDNITVATYNSYRNARAQ